MAVLIIFFPKLVVSDEKKSDTENDSSVPRKRSKCGQSHVWHYFNKSVDGKTAKCIKCDKSYKTSGNTTNLTSHLKRMHPRIKLSDLPQRLNQPVLSFVNNKYESSSNQKKKLDSALCYYITSDLRPFSVVENKGFRHLINLLDPR